MAVSAQVWEHLLNAGGARTFRPGTPLLRQGEAATHVLALVSGRVKIVLTSADGNTLILGIRGPREILGDMAVLGHAERSATVIAIDPCETRRIEASRFLRLVETYRLEADLLSHAMTRIREGEQWRAELAQLPAGPRLARTLVHLVAADSWTPADVGLSQTEVGQAAGLSRAMVAAELRHLRELGVIETGRRRITIIDMPALRDTARLEPSDSGQ